MPRLVWEQSLWVDQFNFSDKLAMVWCQCSIFFHMLSTSKCLISVEEVQSCIFQLHLFICCSLIWFSPCVELVNMNHTAICLSWSPALFAITMHHKRKYWLGIIPIKHWQKHALIKQWQKCVVNIIILMH